MCPWPRESSDRRTLVTTMSGVYDTALNDRETLELAQRLVRIDSVNPSLVPGAEGEAALAHFVAGFLENRGLDAELRHALAGRRKDWQAGNAARWNPSVDTWLEK